MATRKPADKKKPEEPTLEVQYLIRYQRAGYLRTGLLGLRKRYCVEVTPWTLASGRVLTLREYYALVRHSVRRAPTAARDGKVLIYAWSQTHAERLARKFASADLKERNPYAYTPVISERPRSRPSVLKGFVDGVVEGSSVAKL